MPVVVAEHGQHRRVQLRGRLGQHRGLLWLAVRGQIAGQQDQVDAAFERGERGAGALAVARAEVHVPGRGDADPALIRLLGAPAGVDLHRDPRVPTAPWPQTSPPPPTSSTR
jgi:hypothetical protein